MKIDQFSVGYLTGLFTLAALMYPTKSRLRYAAAAGVCLIGAIFSLNQ